MDHSPTCPVCNHLDWDALDVKRYSRNKVAPDSYTKIRREVLFDIWFPHSDDITLESVVCKVCGFLCYTPRPEEKDIDNKYIYLSEHPQAKQEFGIAKKSDAARSRDLYRFLKPFIDKQTSTILDYGGGNGRLLDPFLRDGLSCHIIDLVDETLPGINYLGHSLRDTNMSFDIVICSHVLEHLVDPLETTVELSKLLNQAGRLYIEVPNEIWGKIPPARDPVTHINFFTSDSLRTLLEFAGMEVIYCDYSPFTRPNGMKGMAVKAIAKKNGAKGAIDPKLRGPGMVFELAGIGLLSRIWRIMKHPSFLKNFFKA